MKLNIVVTAAVKFTNFLKCIYNLNSKLLIHNISKKEGHTNIQISAELGSNWRPCGQKAEFLPTKQTTLAKNIYLCCLLDLSVSVVVKILPTTEN